MKNVSVTATATFVGLAVAWGGTALLLTPATRLLGAPESLATMVLEQLVLWALAGAIVAIIVVWEKRPLASIGLRSLGWQSAGWGLLLAAALFCVVMPLLRLGLRVTGIPVFEAGLSKILILPVWFRIFAVVTAGIVEDTIFLGFPVTRLTQLTGSPWMAGAVSVPVFALFHLPNWGAGPVLIYLVTGGITTAFFIWRQDLSANMMAHVTVDALALVIVPALSRAA